MQTRIVGGIDEAGLGPMLGPMTLGVAALRVPVDDAASEWQRLASAVTRKPEGDDRRLVVADSKVVFTRNPRGHARLERTVLTLLGASHGKRPTVVDDLFTDAPESLRPCPRMLERHPWYARLPERLPTWCGEESIEPHAGRLQRALERSGTELLAAFPRLVTAAELNASFERTDNKSATTWDLCADLIVWFWERFGSEDPTLVVDRQGGRMHYAAPLWERFPDGWIETRREGKRGCEYVVHQGGQRMTILFRERAEEVSFAVALASCAAKYLRELSMEGFNRYFDRLQEGLRPTAGYVTDARRWLEEAAPALERASLDPDVLVRTR